MCASHVRLRPISYQVALVDHVYCAGYPFQQPIVERKHSYNRDEASTEGGAGVAKNTWSTDSYCATTLWSRCWTSIVLSIRSHIFSFQNSYRSTKQSNTGVSASLLSERMVSSNCSGSLSDWLLILGNPKGTLPMALTISEIYLNCLDVTMRFSNLVVSHEGVGLHLGCRFINETGLQISMRLQHSS